MELDQPIPAGIWGRNFDVGQRTLWKKFHFYPFWHFQRSKFQNFWGLQQEYVGPSWSYYWYLMASCMWSDCANYVTVSPYISKELQCLGSPDLL